MKRSQLCMFMIGTALLALSGCQHIGPQTIVDDRIPYNEAISTSWKQQTLLNIVRLRYMDVPEFVDVPSIVNGYEHSRSLSGGLGAEVFPRNSVSNLLGANLNGSRGMVDRPTISYAPQTGSEFTRNLTNPLPPVSILNLIESGYPADVVMDLAVESINGVRNRSFTGSMQPGDPEFPRVLELMRKAQASGTVSLRLTQAEGPDGSDVVMSIRDRDIPADLADELTELREILSLDLDQGSFKVVFGMLPAAKDELAIRTRSILRILTFLALNVQVPEAHLADGRVPDLGDMPSAVQPQMTVLSGCELPADAYVAVRYQGHYFWIDQRDLPSKRSLNYLKLLLALADTERKESAPALTIRAN